MKLFTISAGITAGSILTYIALIELCNWKLRKVFN